MCVVSMIMDHQYDKWHTYLPLNPLVQPVDGVKKDITQEEIDEFHRLLERAREYDKRNNEPNCELSEKKQKLLDLAKELGVEIDFI